MKVGDKLVLKLTVAVGLKLPVLKISNGCPSDFLSGPELTYLLQAMRGSMVKLTTKEE